MSNLSLRSEGPSSSRGTQNSIRPPKRLTAAEVAAERILMNGMAHRHFPLSRTLHPDLPFNEPNEMTAFCIDERKSQQLTAAARARTGVETRANHTENLERTNLLWHRS